MRPNYTHFWHKKIGDVVRIPQVDGGAFLVVEADHQHVWLEQHVDHPNPADFLMSPLTLCLQHQRSYREVIKTAYMIQKTYAQLDAKIRTLTLFDGWEVAAERLREKIGDVVRRVWESAVRSEDLRLAKELRSELEDFRVPRDVAICAIDHITRAFYEARCTSVTQEGVTRLFTDC